MNRSSDQCEAMPWRQRGAVLFVSLVILLVLSLLAIVSVNTSITETRMAGGARNMQLAQFAADSAAKEAQSRIASFAAAYGADQVCAHIRCIVRDVAAPADAATFMQTASAKAATIAFRIDFTHLRGIDESTHLAAAPGYVIEDLGITRSDAWVPVPSGVPPTHDFRITARGVGGTDSFVRIVESVYSIPDHKSPP